MLSATLAKRKLLKLHAQMTYKQKEKQYYNFLFAKANNKSVTLTLAPPAFIIMPTKIP